MDIDRLLDVAGGMLANWLTTRRDLHRPHARPLPEAAIVGLRGWFADDLLARARIREVAAIEQPEQLLALARDAGLEVDFGPARGTAFVDTIVVLHGETALDLIFHELVHVEQFERRGVEGFAEAYVRGWAAHGFAYSTIPLEAEAFALQRRFAAGERFVVGESLAG
ncbi:hypothetical protein ACNOYE_01190 [Nannocystaceae bacterium ST9]